ncbi:MAG: cytochrome ubiquinol oxidase subunit I [Candidatus Dormibacteraceae bacterium]
MPELHQLLAPAVAHLLDIRLPARSPDFGGLLGHRIAIGSMFEAHILVSGLVSGATQLGPAIEWLGYMRRRPGYDRLAHGMARFLIYYFSIGAALAIFLITVTLTVLWGHAWSVINRVAFWPFFIEAWTFFLMVILTYLWYYSWDSLRKYKWLHMSIGGLLAIASFVQVLMIDVVASYMLTPTPPRNPIAVFLNPTEYPLQIHRTIANLAYIGFGIGAFSAIRYLRARTAADRAFYDWAGSFGLLWGIVMTLLQPVVGYSYAKEIQLHAYGAWYKMMQGTLSPEFLTQIFILGLMFLVAVWYFARRLRSSGAPGALTLKALTVLLVVTTVFAVLPYQLTLTYDQAQAQGLAKPFWQGGVIDPFAAMIPYKIAALTAFTVFAIAGVFWYLRGLPKVVWGSSRRGEQGLLVASAVLAMAMIVLMGFIRENSRYPDVVAGHISLHQQQTLNQPNVQPAGGGAPFP